MRFRLLYGAVVLPVILLVGFALYLKVFYRPSNTTSVATQIYSISPTPTQASILPSTSKTSAADWVIFGEDERYTVRIDEFFPTSREVLTTIIDKQTAREYPIHIRITSLGAVGVSSSPNKQYVVFDSGTGTERDIIVLNVWEGTQVMSNFRSRDRKSKPIVLNNLVVFDEVFQSLSNRPSGYATEVMALNLQKKKFVSIVRPDLLNDYYIDHTEGDSIYVNHEIVLSESDWIDDSLIKHELIPFSIQKIEDL